MRNGVFDDIRMSKTDVSRLQCRIFPESWIEESFKSTYEADTFRSSLAKLQKFNEFMLMLQTRNPNYMVSTLISQIISLSKTTDEILVIVKEIIDHCIAKFGKKTLETKV